METQEGVSFWLTPDPTLASGDYAITVEAEYGSLLVEGTVYTAAHHQKEGPYSSTVAPPPCCNEDIPRLTRGRVLLSHVDLDSLGGCLRVLPEFADLFTEATSEFWELAGFVDLNGPHKLCQAPTGAGSSDLLHAFWAWSQANRGPNPSKWDGEKMVSQYQEITGYIHEAGVTLRRIIVERDSGLLSAGDEFRQGEAKLNKASFVEHRDDGVVVRVSDKFVNQLYASPDREIGLAVVAFNTQHGSVTVSLADNLDGVSCRDTVQKVFPDRAEDGSLLAGGRENIAGSPRQRRATLEEFHLTVDTLRKALR